MNSTYREKNHSRLGDIVDGIPLTRIHYLALILVVTGGLFEVLEQLILSSLGPSLQEALDVDASDIALLSTATLLALAAGGVCGGYLADRIGRRSVLAWSVGIYSVGSIIAAFSPDYGILMIARIITGIGVGGEIAVGLTYLSELTPTRIRGLFVSLFNTISAGVGMFVAYAYTIIVLGPFAEAISAGEDAWRWAFGLLGIPAVLVFFMRRYLPESPRFLLEKHRTADLNVALTRLEKGRARLRDEQPTVYFSQEQVDAAANEIVAKERKHVSELFKPGMKRRTVGLATVAFLAWGAQFSVLLLMPVLLVERGYSISGSLLFTMVQNLGGLVGAIIASVGAYRFPRRRMIAIGAVAAFLSILLFAFFASTPFLIMALGFLFNLCVMLVNTTIWTWSPELFPTKVRGLGTSVVVNVGFIGGALIPLITAALYEAANLYATFGIVAVLYLAILGISRVVTETHNKSFEELAVAERSPFGHQRKAS